jgi:peptidoglycan/LPS O-acetylase OafA/YrhL
MSSEKTLQSLQAGRGLAALSVVLFHASAVFALPKYWNSHPFGLWLQPANSGVYYFFILSGFIIAYAHAKDVGNPHRLSRYVSNRARRIYPMYWIVTAVTLTYLYLAHLVNAAGLNFWFIVGNISLLPFDGDHGTLAVAWTLFHEIVFYIAFASLIVFRRIGISGSIRLTYHERFGYHG